jgi:quercetin dioxygenase-like cupin family protein
MIIQSTNGRAFRQTTLMAGVIAGVVALSATSAFAGGCPAGQMTDDGQKAGATANKGATDNVIGSVDLSKESVALKDHVFRLRKLTVAPGGEVAWHSHADRPAIIYIVSGEMTEYASSCKVPILHKAGEATPETHATAHWWKNTGKKTAVLLSADILHDAMDKSM